MRSPFRLIAPIILLCFLPIIGGTTDLVVQSIESPMYGFRNTAAIVQFKLRNDNVLPASGHSMFVDVLDDGLNTIFSEEIVGGLIEPFTDQIISTSGTWVGETVGTYTINVRVDFLDDIDNSNNELSQQQIVLHSRDDAIGSFFSNAPDLAPCDLSLSGAYLPWNPLYNGDVISGFEAGDTSPTQIVIDQPTWVGYYDCDPESRYTKVGAYYLISALNLETQFITTNSWLDINEATYLSTAAELDTSPDRIHGSAPSFDSVPDANTVHEPNSAPTAERTCAVLVTGEIETDNERNAFNNDINTMEGNLTKETLGAELGTNDIQKLENASFQQVCDAIDLLKTGYDKIIFYYTGHATERYMVTNDTVGNRLWYVDLARKLYDTEAEDLCVIIDGCHSGGAIDVFRNHEKYSERNVTLIASAREDTTALTRRIWTTANDEAVRMGFFTWHFAKCYGDPEANMDDDPKTSFAEAFNWVRRVNPMANKGPMNTVQDPQIIIHRAVRPAAAGNSHGGSRH